MYLLFVLQEFLLGDCTKATKALGWERKYSFKVSIDMLCPHSAVFSCHSEPSHSAMSILPHFLLLCTTSLPPYYSFVALW